MFNQLLLFRKRYLYFMGSSSQRIKYEDIVSYCFFKTSELKEEYTFFFIKYKILKGKKDLYLHLEIDQNEIDKITQILQNKEILQNQDILDSKYSDTRIKRHLNG